MIIEQPRQYRDLKTVLDRFVADPHLPHLEAHADHVDDVLHASKRKGFPVAPCPRKWP